MIAGGKPRWTSDGAGWPHRDASAFISAGGVKWHLQRYGSGPVILFVHGTGASSHSFADLGDLLASDFTILAPDLPGHGFSSTPAGSAMTLPGMARALGALINAIDVQPHLIVGHSAGAAIMIEGVAEKYLAPRGALSINGALAPFGGAGAFMFPMMAKLLALNPFVPAVFAQSAQRRERIEGLIKGTGSIVPARNIELYARLLRRSGHVSGALTMMANWNLEPLQGKLRTLDLDVVFAAGGRDRAVPPQLAADAAKIAAKGEHIVYPSLGHLAHEEDPLSFATLIRKIAAKR